MICPLLNRKLELHPCLIIPKKLTMSLLLSLLFYSMAQVLKQNSNSVVANNDVIYVEASMKTKRLGCF